MVDKTQPTCSPEAHFWVLEPLQRLCRQNLMPDVRTLISEAHIGGCSLETGASLQWKTRHPKVGDDEGNPQTSPSLKS